MYKMGKSSFLPHSGHVRAEVSAYMQGSQEPVTVRPRQHKFAWTLCIRTQGRAQQNLQGCPCERTGDAFSSIEVKSIELGTLRTRVYMLAGPLDGREAGVQ